MVEDMSADYNFESVMKNEKRKKRTMKLLFAKHILKIMPDLIHEKCYGCQVDHPSQRHHDVCCMMKKEERVEAVFETALGRINEFEIFEEYIDFFPEVRVEIYTNYDPFHTADYDEFKEDLKNILNILY